MTKPLKLQVLLNAVDKATAPLRKITASSSKTAKALRENRDQLRALETAQKDLRSFRDLKQQASETGNELRKQQQRVKALSNELRQNGADTRALTAERSKAIKKAQQLTQQFDAQRQKAHQLKAAVRDTHGITGKLAGSEQSLARQIKTANQQIDQQQQKLKRLAAQEKKSAEARAAYNRGMSMRTSMAGTGAGMMATGGSALYAGARLLQPGVEFGQSMSRVQALSRLDKNDPRFEALRQQARDLGASTAFSAGQAADAQGFLAMAGFNPDAIKAAMPDMLNLALANGADLARTADISSNILSGFGLDPNEMGRVGDVLTATTTRANVDLEMLGESMKYVAPQARAMSLSLEQAAAMTGLLGNVGIQGSQAGTTLRAMMTRLAAPTGKAAASLKALNVQAKDADGNMRDVPRILADVAKATENMGNADRAGYLKEIFGEEPGAGMAELIAQQGAAGIEKFTEILTDAAGENARVAKTMADNIGGDLKGLSSAWDDVGISITDTNDGPLRDLIQTITRVTRGVGSWIKANPKLAGTIAKIAAGLAVVITAGGALTLMLASLMGPMVMVRYGMAMLGPNVMTAGRALLWMGGVFRTLAAFMLTNPIGIAIGLIAAAAYLIYRYWEPIKAFFTGLWGDVKAAFNAGIGGIAQLLINWSPLGLLYRGITAALTALGVEIPEKFKGLGGMIVDGLIGGLKDKMSALKDTVTGVGSNVTGWFKEKMGIHSPSRVFAALGGYTVDGLNVGIEQQQDEPAKRVMGIAKRLTKAAGSLTLGSALAMPALASSAVDLASMRSVALDGRPAMSAQAGSASPAPAININVNAAPGMDEAALARYVAQEVQRAMAQEKLATAARSRSSMWDRD